MKKLLVAATIYAIYAIFSTSAMADALGLYVGGNYHNNNATYNDINTKDNSNYSGYVAFEHFIPLIPNAKLRYIDLKNKEGKASSALNAILYYQIFDNKLFKIDLGLAYTNFKDYSQDSADLAQAYGAAKIYIPGTGLFAFSEIVGGSVTKDEALDANAGLGYTFNPDSPLVNLSLRTGYRYQTITIDKKNPKPDQENKGIFAGLELHF